MEVGMMIQLPFRIDALIHNTLYHKSMTTRSLPTDLHSAELMGLELIAWRAEWSGGGRRYLECCCWRSIKSHLTNRCSCPLEGRLDQWMQPGNPMQFWADAAGQLNSMLYSIVATPVTTGTTTMQTIPPSEEALVANRCLVWQIDYRLIWKS